MKRTPSRPVGRVAAWLAPALIFTFSAAEAEPYFAIETGQPCAGCHTNPSGGGKRTAYGNAFAQLQLPATPNAEFWGGDIVERLSIGGDIRANAAAINVPDQPDESFAFALEEALIYAELMLLENRLKLYLDQRVGPGGSSNREAYALLDFADGRSYLKAGRMFLPFGWRLEDDTEFIRQVSGINYNTPDDGIEIGYRDSRYQAQLALTNGTAGGGENDSGKQFSLRAARITGRWRVALSGNLNDSSGGKRIMYGLAAGVKTGPVSWLAEIDRIEDESAATEPRRQWLGFVEANWKPRQGHNVKFTYGHFEPDSDVSEDERNRASVVWEYFPLAFTQVSAGWRRSDGIPQNPLQNADEYFLQLHLFY